jgi:hypothetical protein
MKHALKAVPWILAVVSSLAIGARWCDVRHNREMEARRAKVVEFDEGREQVVSSYDLSPLLDLVDRPSGSGMPHDKVDISGIPKPAQLGRLRRAGIKEFRIPAEWLYHVFDEPAFPKLETLYLRASAMGADLSRFPSGSRYLSVTALGIPRTIGTRSGLKNLVERFPNVEWVDLSDSDLDDESCRELRGWTSLGRLYIPGTRVTARALAELRDCKKLKYVQAMRTAIRADQVNDDLGFEIQVD